MPTAPIDRSTLLDDLKRLLPEQLSEVIFLFDMPTAYLADKTAHVEKAIALILYAEQHQAQAHLAACIRQVRGVKPPLPQHTEPAIPVFQTVPPTTGLGLRRLKIALGLGLPMLLGVAILLPIADLIPTISPKPAPTPPEPPVTTPAPATSSTPTPPVAAPQATGQRIKRYLAYADGTALDTETGLLWTRCLVGQTWAGNSCAGKATEFNWEQATQQTTHFAGHKDWRLPTIEELRTLVYCSNGKPAEFSLGKHASSEDIGCAGEPGKDHDRPTLVAEVFPNAPANFVWSSSAYAHTSNYAWGVNFYYGYAYDGNRNGDLHVRLVRGGQ